MTRLEGPNLGLLSLTRHPVRPFLAAALTNGKVKLVDSPAVDSSAVVVVNQTGCGV